MTKTATDATQSTSVDEAPRHARGRIVFDPNWCRTCRVCEVACSIFHEGAARPSLARIRITYDEFKAVDPISALVCAQCEDAPCMEACPVDAMRRDERTGAVLVDEELCIGCMQCREACPWEIPVLHPEKGVSIKCDLCGDREGGPACVAWCPLSGRALRYVQDDTIERSDA